MQPPNPPPRKRNAQVRTYKSLLSAALRDAAVDDRETAADVLRELRYAEQRIRRNSLDPLDGVDVRGLIINAHRLLGYGDATLPPLTAQRQPSRGGV